MFKIDDWVVELGFDGKAVKDGVSKIDKMMQRLDKTEATIAGRKKAQISQQKEINKLLNEQNKLLGKTPTPRQPRVAVPTGSSTKQTANTRTMSVAQQAANQVKLDKLLNKVRTTAGLSAEQVDRLTRRIELQRLRIDKVNTSNVQSITKFRNSMERVTRDVNASTGAFKKSSFAANKLSNSLKNLAAQYISVFAAIEGSRALAGSITAFDSLNASLLAASGSSEQALKDFGFIKDLSMKMGIELKVVADGYRQIGAASRAAGVDTTNLNKQFEQMTKISRSFGLGSADTKLVMLAFQQMISKGVVSSEELRRQLGERLPGAVPHAANALGVTTLELSNMLKRGEVMTNDFLPKFLDQMEKSVVESGAYAASLKTVTAESQRFTTTMQMASVAMGDSGLKSGFINFLDRMGESVTQLMPLWKTLGAVAGLALNTLTFTLDMILAPVLQLVSALLKPMVEMFEDAFNLDKAVDDITVFSTALRYMLGYFQLLLGVLYGWIGGIQLWLLGLDETGELLKTVRQGIGALFGLWVGGKIIRSLWRLVSGFLAVAGAIGKVTGASSLMGATAGAGAMGILSKASRLGGAGLAGAAGYGAGTLVTKGIEGTGFGDFAGEWFANIAALFSDEAARAVETTRANAAAVANANSTITNSVQVEVNAGSADAEETAKLISEKIEENLINGNTTMAMGF